MWLLSSLRSNKQCFCHPFWPAVVAQRMPELCQWFDRALGDLANYRGEVICVFSVSLSSMIDSNDGDIWRYHYVSDILWTQNQLQWIYSLTAVFRLVITSPVPDRISNPSPPNKPTTTVHYHTTTDTNCNSTTPPDQYPWHQRKSSTLTTGCVSCVLSTELSLHEFLHGLSLTDCCCCSCCWKLGWLWNGNCTWNRGQIEREWVQIRNMHALTKIAWCGSAFCSD